MQAAPHQRGTRPKDNDKNNSKTSRPSAKTSKSYIGKGEKMTRMRFEKGHAREQNFNNECDNETCSIIDHARGMRAALIVILDKYALANAASRLEVLEVGLLLRVLLRHVLDHLLETRVGLPLLLLGAPG